MFTLRIRGHPGCFRLMVDSMRVDNVIDDECTRARFAIID